MNYEIYHMVTVPPARKATKGEWKRREKCKKARLKRKYKQEFGLLLDRMINTTAQS